MVELEPMGLRPGIQLVDAQARIPEVSQLIHKQSVARGRAQRIQHKNFPVGILGLQQRLGGVGGVIHPGNARGQAHMEDVQALLQKSREIGHEFVHIHLGGLGVRAVGHGLIKLVEGHTLPQIVGVLHPVHLVVEANIVDVPILKMLL